MIKAASTKMKPEIEHPISHSQSYLGFRLEKVDFLFMLAYRCLMLSIVRVAFVCQGEQGDHEQTDTCDL